MNQQADEGAMARAATRTSHTLRCIMFRLRFLVAAVLVAFLLPVLGCGTKHRCCPKPPGGPCNGGPPPGAFAPPPPPPGV